MLNIDIQYNDKPIQIPCLSKLATNTFLLNEFAPEQEDWN
jgi:hypothetical protein